MNEEPASDALGKGAPSEIPGATGESISPTGYSPEAGGPGISHTAQSAPRDEHSAFATFVHHQIHSYINRIRLAGDATASGGGEPPGQSVVAPAAAW